MSAPLPSLTALRAFESASRHLNMSRAAEELFRTHGAVSRQIKQLEEELGYPLFVRGGRLLELTDEGRVLSKRLSAAFDDISSTLEDLQEKRKGKPLVVACGSTVAVRWLVPRLMTFYHQHPKIKIQLSLSTQVEEMTGRSDVAIRWGGTGGELGGAGHIPLMDDRIGPVCNRSFAQTHGIHEGMAPQELLQTTLIHSDTVPNAWQDWQEWMGLDGPLPKHQAIRFEHFFLCLQAAVSGIGLAMASQALVAQDLELGNLIAPLGFVKVSGGYEVLKSDQPQNAEACDKFIGWLLSEGQKTQAALRKHPEAAQSSAS
ncbi:LysR substrate-binding domain-containing protein [Pseudovibrio sp. SPO723]|uniref:LysR substrate-binding domain-containing protein n=1 Tax=Nesiotobacter zosterae TaxID=392721 RepID=UPI0029C5E840|nr:LysR substrate-binding domain-containing protein [Pseudovibrio sp. SPO723]MDX5593992.1 LysR substrate-binding domain-containing protein [Pseudovibrio sp. SPO723]